MRMYDSDVTENFTAWRQEIFQKVRFLSVLSVVCPLVHTEILKPLEDTASLIKVARVALKPALAQTLMIKWYPALQDKSIFALDKSWSNIEVKEICGFWKWYQSVIVSDYFSEFSDVSISNHSLSALNLAT